MGEPIRSILVAGGGLEGWLTALTLVRRLPGVRVSVLDQDTPSAPADLYAGTRPSFRRALAKLAIDEGGLLKACGGVARLGQRYEGWAADRPPYLHCFGRYGVRLGSAPFHQGWLRAAAAGSAAPFGCYSAAVMLAEAGRMVRPSTDEYSPLATFDFGFGLDPMPLRNHLRTLAIADGVEHRRATLLGVDVADGNRITALRLAGGAAVSADLLIDCTGPEALLLSALPGGDVREDWSKWLPCDRLLVASGPSAAGDLPLVDTATATAAGWRLHAPLRSRTIHLLACSGEETSTDQAATLLEGAAGSRPDMHAVALPQGRRHRFWIGNCLALGDAAVTLEPLGAPGLHILTQSLERLLWFLPDTDFSAVEIDEYNRRAAIDADFVRNFVILHYATSRRDEPLWRAAASTEAPEALAHTIALFRARGKIPGRDGETAELDDWLAVLIGQGVRAAQADPMLDALPPGEFDEVAAAIRATIDEAVAAAPSHAAFLRSFASA